MNILLFLSVFFLHLFSLYENGQLYCTGNKMNLLLERKNFWNIFEAPGEQLNDVA
jgi:hypothetical protein